MNPFFKVARVSRLSNSEIRNVKGGASSGNFGGAGGAGGFGGGGYACVHCNGHVESCPSRRCIVLDCNVSEKMKGTECSR